MMKHRPIPMPSSDGTAIVHDVLELAALCVEDLRKTSEETDAPGETGEALGAGEDNCPPG